MNFRFGSYLSLLLHILFYSMFLIGRNFLIMTAMPEQKSKRFFKCSDRMSLCFFLCTILFSSCKLTLPETILKPLKLDFLDVILEKIWKKWKWKNGKIFDTIRHIFDTMWPLNLFADVEKCCGRRLKRSQVWKLYCLNICLNGGMPFFAERSFWHVSTDPPPRPLSCECGYQW